MPDTEAPQQASPQPSPQAPGWGCFGARIVVVWSWAWGAVWAAAVGRFTGKNPRELRLFHRLYASLECADVILAARASGSYWEVALVWGPGSASVMRWQQRRPVDWRGGRRVGREEPGVSWSTPPRAAWLDAATEAGWPAAMDRRVLRGGVPQRGFRPRVVLVATTWLETQGYAKEALAGLSRARWHAAWARRSSKQTLQLDVLRGTTPARVRKEMWGPLLVDTLLRAAMAQAALAHGGATPGKPPRATPDAGGL